MMLLSRPMYTLCAYASLTQQRTKVACSWETEDALRGGSKRVSGRNRSTASQWRDMAESDMQQYLANSSSSEDEDESRGSDSEGSVSVAESSDDNSDDMDRRSKSKKKMSKK